MRFATFSIVARDPRDDSFGVAVASKFLAVGAYVPFAKAGVGAIATQALANLSYGPDGLAALAGGASAEDTVRALIQADAARDHRQLGIVDASGGAATYTGADCYDWAGGFAGDGFAVQGNILAGETVVNAMARAYVAADSDLPHRLLAALRAGDEVGGDRRGKQSAALFVVRPGAGYQGRSDRWLDLRVDDHLFPVKELGRPVKLHTLYFGKSPEGEKLRLDPALTRELLVLASAAGHYKGLCGGEFTPAAREALVRFIGTENLEDRVDLAAGTIDPPALSHLREKFG